MNYEFEGKNEKEAIEKAAAELGLERDEFDVEIVETQKKSLFKAGYVKIRITPVKETNVNSDSGRSYDLENVAKRTVTNPLAQDDFEQKLIDFVNEIISKMGYEAAVQISFREDKKIGIKLERFLEIEPLLIKYGLLNEDSLTLDDGIIKVYHKLSNPEIRPLLIMAYQFINARQCYYNFTCDRTKPYFEYE